METERKNTIEAWIVEADGRLTVFERNLPRRCDPVAMSRSKLPFKALSYRETLTWRMTELGRCALEHFKQDKVAAAVLLTRAVVETTASLWFLRKKIAAAVKAAELGDIDNYLMKLAFGTKQWEEFPAAINVLTFVDSVEKEVEGFRKQYDSLSEIAHPNYAGTTGLFSTTDYENILISFGPNSKQTFNAKLAGMANLSSALGIFEHCYNKMADELPAFVELCEQAIDKKGCPEGA
jgi:hypothetical protein